MHQFLWRPGAGVDLEALARLRARFARPAEPMGEAWFMGSERRMYGELLGDLACLTARQLQEPLEEIASGTSAFGPLTEWHDWYHYLLGQLVPRSHEAFVRYLLEPLVTGFIALYPNGIHAAPYPQFHHDVLLTLGRCMMDAECWNNDEIVVGTILHRSNNNPNKVWCWWDASGGFSASLYFCLKYLPALLVNDWFASALAIRSPHWRAQVLVWLVGSHDLLHGKMRWPSEWSVGVRPSVSWDWSHCLNSELAASDQSGAAVVDSLLPDASCQAVLAIVREYFTEQVFLRWLESIGRIPYLEAELAEIPNTFAGLYLSSGEA